MSWVELQWAVPRKDTEFFSSRLFQFGALGVQEDFLEGEAPPPRQPWDTGEAAPLPPYVLLRAWWEQEGLEKIQMNISSLAISHPETKKPSWNNISDQNWANSWRDHFSRKVFSERLAIAPPWEAQAGDLVIEPGIAFGTGEHPTTASCLEAIAAWADEGKTCLDVGCGSGILALAAAKLGYQVFGIDIEKQAIDAAKHNAKVNQLEATFSDTDIADIEEQYDIVVANLYAEVLVQLAPYILRTVGSKIALAGILTTKANLVLDAFSSLQLIRQKEEGDWTSLWFSKI